MHSKNAIHGRINFEVKDIVNRMSKGCLSLIGSRRDCVTTGAL